MKNKTKLAIFDLDGTLVNSPLPDTGKAIYEEKTGKPWPHKGFWGHEESLDMNIFDIPVNPDVIADYHIEKQDPKSEVIMMTGRLEKLSHKVHEILTAHGLEFDAYYFNRGGSTEVYKLKSIDQLLDKYPDIEMVEFWEDRLAHVTIFEEWGKNHCLSGRLKDFKINVIVSDTRDGMH